jgi:hypothetical protein
LVLLHSQPLSCSADVIWLMTGSFRTFANDRIISTADLAVPSVDDPRFDIETIRVQCHAPSPCRQARPHHRRPRRIHR